MIQERYKVLPMLLSMAVQKQLQRGEQILQICNMLVGCRQGAGNNSLGHSKNLFRCKRRHGKLGQEAVQVFEASLFLFLQLLQEIFDGVLLFCCSCLACIYSSLCGVGRWGPTCISEIFVCHVFPSRKNVILLILQDNTKYIGIFGFVLGY